MLGLVIRRINTIPRTVTTLSEFGVCADSRNRTPGVNGPGECGGSLRDMGVISETAECSHAVKETFDGGRIDREKIGVFAVLLHKYQVVQRCKSLY